MSRVGTPQPDLASALAKWLADPRTQQDLVCATEVDVENMIREFLQRYRKRLLQRCGEVN